MIDEVLDARGKPVGVDLHPSELGAQGRQAFPEAMPEMLEPHGPKMRRGGGDRRPAQSQRDTRIAQVEERQNDVEHRPEAGAVVGELTAGLD